ncbi:hypothetical protein BD769DRAFT_1473067 [Suillus cothurnatus]|nr:hypothetical protein BD769DRAFT_1473067 [Suillus cothurnatus]
MFPMPSYLLKSAVILVIRGFVDVLTAFYENRSLVEWLIMSIIGLYKVARADDQVVHNTRHAASVFRNCVVCT